MDAWAGRRRLSGLKVRLPDKLRWVLKRASLLELSFTTTGVLPLHLRVGLGLPPEFNPNTRNSAFNFPHRPASTWFRTNAFPRGADYSTSTAVTSRPSLPCVFGCSRQRSPSIEVRVYPNMEAERKQSASSSCGRATAGHSPPAGGTGPRFREAARIRSRRRPGHHSLEGHRAERTPDHQDFSNRKNPGSLRHRRLIPSLRPPAGPGRSGPGHPSRPLHYRSPCPRSRGRKAGRPLGLVTFGDQVGNFVRARNGKEHYGACREALYRLEAQPVSLIR